MQPEISYLRGQSHFHFAKDRLFHFKHMTHTTDEAQIFDRFDISSMTVDHTKHEHCQKKCHFNIWSEQGLLNLFVKNRHFQMKSYLPQLRK